MEGQLVENVRNKERHAMITTQVNIHQFQGALDLLTIKPVMVKGLITYNGIKLETVAKTSKWSIAN